MASPPLTSPLNEQELRALGKKVQTYTTTHSPWQLQETIERLIETANYPELSSTHRIAAFNALCGFVDQCSESRDDQVREIALRPELCLFLLHIYLERYEYSRPKSMKQLLGSVVKAIARQVKISEPNWTNDSIKILVAIICNDDQLKIKPCFHVLSSLIHRNIVPISDVLTVFDTVVGILSSPTSLHRANAEDFLLIVLNWSRKTEIAPIAGVFISTFSKSLMETNLAGHNDCLWAEPLVKMLHQYPEDFPTYRMYVMPGLFALDIEHYWSFLCQAGLRTILGLSEDESTSKSKAKGCGAINAEHLFGSLQVGKELGIIELTDALMCPSVRLYGHVIQVCNQLLGSLAGDSDLDVRLSGMSLLISSKQQSRPLTTGTMKSLKRFIPMSYLEPDAKFRGDFLSLIQTLVDRIKAVSSSLFRTVQQHTKRGHVQSVRLADRSLELHKNFMQWLIHLSVFELHPHASYQRHFTALNVILVLLRSGLDKSIPDESLSRQARTGVYWSFSLQVLDDKLFRVLMDVIIDPFEDVRQLAASILKLAGVARNIPNSNSSGSNPLMQQVKPRISNEVALQYNSAMSKTRDIMLSTGRIDHADGFARFTNICFHKMTHTIRETNQAADTQISINLQSQEEIVSFFQENVSQIAEGVRVSKIDLMVAVEQFPIHGMLTSVRYILEEISDSPKIRNSIIKSKMNPCKELNALMHDIWCCVKDTLCNDAPEGYLPEDGGDNIPMTTRDLLSYCWRALKESSLLLRSLVGNINLICDSQDHESILGSVGTLCFTQLAELRHRGAFSTVAQSFASICLQCQASSSHAVKDLRLQWYSATLDLIESQGAKITRRSAGIPSAMVGLLASGLDFNQAVKDLRAIAERDLSFSRSGQTDLPQVHALNCLRAMFTSTKLDAKSEQQIIGAITIAAKALSSETWPIRNCGLMLFRSLTDRLLGSHESFSEAFSATVGSRLAYERYPGLLHMLKRLLGSLALADDGGVTPECIFPALDLLRRAPPPIDDRTTILPLILRAAGSTQWHIREAAARAFATLSIGTKGYNLAMLSDFHLQPENDAHGRLLCVKYIFLLVVGEAISDVEGPLTLEFISQVLQDLPLKYAKDKSPSIMTLKIFAELNAILHSTLIRLICDNDIRAASSKRIFPESFEAKILSNLENSLVHLETFGDHTKLSPGKPGIETFLMLARILQILANVCLFSRYSLDFDRNASRIARMLDSQHAEGFEHIVDVLFKLLDSLKTKDTLRLLLAKALSLLLDSKSDLSPSTCSSPRQQERRRDAARSNFVRVYRSISRHAFDKLGDVRIVLANLNLRKECLEATSPASIQSTLEIWGASIDAKYTLFGSWTYNLTAEAIYWIRLVRLAILETSEFAVRHAAVLSLDGFKHSLASKLEIPEEVAVAIYMAVYTALVDDDEDIRKIAANIVGRIRYSMEKPTNRAQSAPLAAQVLCNLLLKDRQNSSLVVEEGIARMIGSGSIGTNLLENPGHRLHSALQEDDALFVIEKQNLFIDPVREASTWAAVLKNCSATTITTQSASFLTSWTLNGLNAIIAYAQSHNDGPLGWTAKPEVFGLGMQILAAADVVLEWRSRSRAVTTRASRIRSLLMILVRDALKTRLHELWIQRTEEILIGSVRLRVARVAVALSKVRQSLCQAQSNQA